MLGNLVTINTNFYMNDGLYECLVMRIDVDIIYTYFTHISALQLYAR